MNGKRPLPRMKKPILLIPNNQTLAAKIILIEIINIHIEITQTDHVNLSTFIYINNLIK